jgi:hypothetical protein
MFSQDFNLSDRRSFFEGDLRLGRWQALDKGEVRPTPAFRLLRVGANSYVIESLNIALSGKYCILEYAYPVGGSPPSRLQRFPTICIKLQR